MRVCANSNSEFYNPFYMGSQVWLDGKRIDKVIEADDENGWLIRRDFNDGYDTILRGRVSIVNPRLLPIPCFRVTGAARMIPLPALLAVGWTPRMLCDHGYAERIKV